MTFHEMLGRVRAMRGEEIAWRAKEGSETLLQRTRARIMVPRWRRADLARRLAAGDGAVSTAAGSLRRADWVAAHAALSRHFAARPPRFLLHPGAREAVRAAVLAAHPDAATSAAARADRTATGFYDLLGYQGLRFGDGEAIDWHLDPVSGCRAPRVFRADVRYLEPAFGDHKVIWELNRHQEWLQLGRAWWLTGDARYRRTFVRQLESWLDANPPGLGINWASALELGLRSLSWLWALELFTAEAEHDDHPWTIDLMLGLHEQLDQVERRLSRYFSPNTHLLGEGLALYVCGRALPEFSRSARWAQVGRRVLLAETTRQILPDGVHAERSTHYHRYALDFYLLALATARITADHGLADRLHPVVLGLARFMLDVSDDTGRFPLLGDDDGGELAPVTGRSPGDARASLGWAAALLNRDELAVGADHEAVTWVTAVCGPPRPGAGPRRATTERRSRAYPAAGYFVSRQPHAHLVFDAGPLGFLNGGHAHADALSVTLSVDGLPLLVDGGTFTYTMDPALRDYFRSTPAHNTATLDGRSQAQPNGAFHWRTMAGGEPRRVACGPRFDYFEGTTDAFAPLEHRRAVFALDDYRWILGDRFAVAGETARQAHVDERTHDAVVYWHLHPDWDAAHDGGGDLWLSHAGGSRAHLSVPGARIEVTRGMPGGPGGWVSPVYGRLVPATTIRCHLSRPAPFGLATVIAAGDGARPASSRLVRVLSADRDGDALAVVSESPDGTEVTLFASEHREMRTIVLDRRHNPAISTDARFLHVRAGADGRIRRICAVDASVVRCEGAHLVTLHARQPASDIDVSFGADGSSQLVSSGPVEGVALNSEPPTVGPNVSSAGSDTVGPNVSSARK